MLSVVQCGYWTKAFHLQTLGSTIVEQKMVQVEQKIVKVEKNGSY
jgi:hypothetical protein